jgi:hypothetical protein
MQAIRRYQQNMGGVDTHDYLRMAKYSIQKSFRMKKWYKQVYLGLFDLAIVNSYIIYKLKNKGNRACLSHADFRERLVTELLAVNVNVNTRTKRKSAARSLNKEFVGDHVLMQFAEKEGYQGRGKQFKQCWVCSKLHAQKIRSTKFYCSECKVAVCDRVFEDRDDCLTCWSLLHQEECQRYLQKKKRQV